MFRQISVLFLYIIVLTSLLSGGCSNSSGNNIGKVPKKVEYSSVSWVQNYPDVESLYANAHVVVKGEVQNTKAFKRGDDVFTEVDFKVYKYYKNISSQPEKESLTVIQDGGILDDTLYKVDLVEIMEKGKTYVLFLKYDDVTGNYFALTGYQGIYEIEKGNAKNSDKYRNLKEKDLMAKIEKSADTDRKE